MAHSFQINFDIEKYKHLWIDKPEDREIINIDKKKEDCVWSKQVPAYRDMGSLELLQKRLKRGAYIIIKDELLWLPPSYYHFLEFGIAGNKPPEFRLKELKNDYFKHWVRANKFAIGTLDGKNRQDGRTTREMSNCLFEAQEGNNTHGNLNIQSKTNRDAIVPCWNTLKSHWLNYPDWYRELMYSDFDGGNNIETKLTFARKEKVIIGHDGTQKILPSRNLLIMYFPAVYNAQDGNNNVLYSYGDEFFKWASCSPSKFLINNEKFIRVGAGRKGLFSLFSSPADVNHKFVDEGKRIWQDSNPEELDEYGTTKSGLFAYHSNPLDGIGEFYDKYGDADPNAVYEFIMSARAKKHKDDLMAEIRANPMNEEEMFGSQDGRSIFENHDGIVEREKFLSTTIYKNEITKEPIGMWGNLEWENGVFDTNLIFRPNDKNEEDVRTGRFFKSEDPDFVLPLIDIKKPPIYVGSSLGIDPVNLLLQAKNGRGSDWGACVYKFRELNNPDFIPRITVTYCSRHSDIDVICEDMIKLCVYTRSMIHYERTSDYIEKYMTERGYAKWIINRKDVRGKVGGDMPRGKSGGQFMTTVLDMVNVLTNKATEGRSSRLEHFWHIKMIRQIIDLDINDTEKSDLFMAFAQALIGVLFMSKKKQIIGDPVLRELMDYVLY